MHFHTRGYYTWSIEWRFAKREMLSGRVFVSARATMPRLRWSVRPRRHSTGRVVSRPGPVRPGRARAGAPYYVSENKGGGGQSRRSMWILSVQF